MKEITLEARVENLDQVLMFLDTQLEEMGCPFKEQTQLDIALEEMYVNVAHYAYTPDTGQVNIKLDVLDDPSGVELTLTDSGVPYDPLAKEDPDVTLSAEEREIGGLGIYMVKKSMDEVAYKHVDGKNIFSMKKFFECE
ncbi:MAG: ATP-binding protein [Lachnospiraceae bacterium]|nr:ATP-binding protein [Lachnospiraceae bacterium]